MRNYCEHPATYLSSENEQVYALTDVRLGFENKSLGLLHAMRLPVTNYKCEVYAALKENAMKLQAEPEK